jgi:ribonuclease HI
MNGKERELVGGEGVTTNNRMELMGAIAALEALKRPVKVVLHSDSTYVIKGASEWIKGWQKKNWKKVANRDLWERLLAAKEPHDVEWVWVRGHAGHTENERVDKLATAEAARQKEQLDVSLRLEVEARIGVECALAGTKDAARNAPPFCARGPGNTGVHCITGSGAAACPHAFVILDRSTLKLQDKAGGRLKLETDEAGRGAATDQMKAILRAVAGPT